MQHQHLAPGVRAFCEALLQQGDVLGVTLSYLPDTVLWLVTTPAQARLMREQQPQAVVLTLGEAADLATSIGDPRPTTLWQVAVALAAPSPAEPQCPDDPGTTWE